MFDTDRFTRTQQTEAHYCELTHREVTQFTRSTGLEWESSRQELLAWLESRRDGVSPAYWRLLRSAMVWFFAQLGESGVSEGIRAIGTDGCTKASRTSANKKKSVSDDDLSSLARHLYMDAKSEIARETFCFLVSGIVAGLRPAEWSAARIGFYDAQGESLSEATPPEIIDKIVLVVENAKSTNGRSHGSCRTLPLANLPNSEKVALLAHWRSVERECQQGTFEQWQRRCSDKLRYATRHLWPSKKKRVTLYSGRHQSMANGKASGLPKNVIAALHGHATDRTSGDHYGRKQYGHAGRSYAQPVEEEVARVREVAKDYTPPDRRQAPTHNREQ